MRQWIGVDIGTQGTKAMLFDDEMRALDSAFEASQLVNPAEGVVWQEPEAILQSVLHVIDKLMHAERAEPDNVKGIGIDSQMAGIMGIDRNGEAATVYDSWLDTRCMRYTEEIRQKAGKRSTELTGGPVSCTHGPKILWWKHKRPAEYARVAKFLLPHAYVVGKLCGHNAAKAYFDHTCLQYSGFGDNLNRCWSEELLEIFHVDGDCFPRIVSPFEVIGELTPSYARQCGLRPGVPLVAGAGDTAASIYGSGMFEPGTALDCAGTASVFCAVVDRYVPDTISETLTMMRSPEENRWYPLAYIAGGGLCLRWFRDELGGKGCDTFPELERLANRVPPGCDGLLFAPHFSGRALPYDPSMRGAYIGLSWTHTRGHLYRAVMESIAYEYAAYNKAMQKLLPDQPVQALYAVGGGSKSALFLQIKSDVLGLPVTTFSMEDAALLGSAVIAAHGVGELPDARGAILRAMTPQTQIKPDAQTHCTYAAHQAAYEETLKHLSELYHSDVYRTGRETSG
ncbi:MAG: hypothetical protein LLF96_12600 [Eubacteriales bacterium]|nr:hypothetical protein [Eubacteriales bacterium]